VWRRLRVGKEEMAGWVAGAGWERFVGGLGRGSNYGLKCELCSQIQENTGGNTVTENAVRRTPKLVSFLQPPVSHFCSLISCFSSEYSIRSVYTIYGSGRDVNLSNPFTTLLITRGVVVLRLQEFKFLNLKLDRCVALHQNELSYPNGGSGTPVPIKRRMMRTSFSTITYWQRHNKMGRVTQL
jgi:hypothetical protein